MTDKESAAKAREGARQIVALGAAELVRDVERVHSLIRFMDDAARYHAREAKERGAHGVEPWVPAVISVNTSWLMDILENRTEKMRGHLGEAGVEVGPMV